MIDKFQKRYLEHQKRKKEILEKKTGEKFTPHKCFNEFWEILRSRRSQRVFIKKKIEKRTINTLLKSVELVPSSCNRRAISVKITRKCKKLDNLLVGGANWLRNADVVFLLFADMRAYKSPAEVEYMPYLDAGVIVENLYLTAEALNLGACFVNPNIREENQKLFNREFNKKGLRFCGAMAFGYYDLKAPSPK